MEDIFVSAKSGNLASVKGLYASSIASAYKAVSAVVADSEQAAEIVQQSYVAALSGANSYEDFFLLLNKRATASCALLLNKNVSLNPIIPSESAFADIESMEIPDALKGFEEPLANIIQKAAKENEKKKLSLPLKKSKTGEKTEDVKSFEKLVDKYEFSGFDDYVPPKEPEPEKPKTLAQKLQGEEITLSPEQLDLDKKEKEKNKKTALLAFIFSAIILVGAISTYFITKSIISPAAQKTTAPMEAVLTEPTVNKKYKKEQIHMAFWDYFHKVVLKKYGKATRERIVAYSENGNIGSEQLNGVVSYNVADMNADGNDELSVITAYVGHSEQNLYTYSFSLSIYTFQNGSVVPLKEDYPLIEYRAYNRGLDYKLDNFKMFLKNVEKDGKHYIYAEASGIGIKICSYHYFENNSMFEAERFAYFAWDYDNVIYMQRHLDGTYEPLYLMLRHQYADNTEPLTPEQLSTLEEYGFHLSGHKVKCKSTKQFRTYFNYAFSRIGYRLNSWNLSFDTADKRRYICYLLTKTVQGDMLSRQNIAKIADYTGLDAYLKEKPTEEKPTTQTQTETTAGQESTTQVQTATQPLGESTVQTTTQSQSTTQAGSTVKVQNSTAN